MSEPSKSVWMRILRVLVFATVYFLVHLFFVFSFIMSAYSGYGEFTWYFYHPLEAFQEILFELGQHPILLIPLFYMVLQSLVFAFVTDLALRFIWKHYRRRKVAGYESKN